MRVKQIWVVREAVCKKTQGQTDPSASRKLFRNVSFPDKPTVPINSRKDKANTHQRSSKFAKCSGLWSRSSTMIPEAVMISGRDQMSAYLLMSSVASLSFAYERTTSGKQRIYIIRRQYLILQCSM